VKGGSFLCAENYCRRYRAAARHPQDVAMGTNHIGFRVAYDDPAPQ
jgi:formylglycine-generating enzyme required for sulfatase activity